MTRATKKTTRFPRRTRPLRNVAAFAVGVSVALATLPLLAHAENPPDDRFARAAESLADGRYDDAEAVLEELVRDRGFAPGVLENLGEAYLADGELGLAIVSFERARLLAPHDPAIHDGLEAARSQAGVSAPERSTVEMLAAVLPARRWLALGAAGLLAFVALAVVVALRRRVGAWVTALSIASGLVTAVSLAALFVGTFGSDDAVVLSDVTARVSPFDTAEVAFDLREGETVEATDRHGTHVEVRTSRGERGWVESASIALVVPRDRAAPAEQ